MPICPKCHSDKEQSDFSKNRSTKSGYSSWCKDCGTEYRKSKPKRKYNFEYEREQELAKKYGILNGDFDRMKLAQNGACAICLQPTSQLVVDHCHLTEVVRGLLCHKCNVGLGHFDDNILRLQAAILYLQKPRETSLLSVLLRAGR